LKTAWKNPALREFFMRNNKLPFARGEYHHSEETKIKMKKIVRKNSRLVLCLETQESFLSCNEAARHLGVSEIAIRSSCNNGYQCKNLHFVFPEGDLK
jgi:hypothetical protein